MNTSPVTRDGGISDWSTQTPWWRQRTPRRPSARDSIGTARKAKVNHAHTKNESFDLPDPLSKLSETLHVPIRDMHSWVERPDKERHQEVSERDGRIPRPVNSFMLYRSAYTNRAKHWIEHNDHRKVSIVIGMSWKLETPQIRTEYENLAKIEKRNHARAHPGYRFLINKGRKRSSAPRRRPKTDLSQLLPNPGQASAPLVDVTTSGHVTKYHIAKRGLLVGISSCWTRVLDPPSHIGDPACCEWPSQASTGQQPTKPSEEDVSLSPASLQHIQPFLTAAPGQPLISDHSQLPPQTADSGSENVDILSNSDSLSVQYVTSPDTVYQSDPHDYSFVDCAHEFGLYAPHRHIDSV
ncbi:hypothetical protein IFM51744_10547 [Aspergillus udagawae]|nr:hypothetical protein IFM51744_10547 [Aspergillus udagawae]